MAVVQWMHHELAKTTYTSQFRKRVHFVGWGVIPPTLREFPRLFRQLTLPKVFSDFCQLVFLCGIMEKQKNCTKIILSMLSLSSADF